jgi:hypothetical protein
VALGCLVVALVAVSGCVPAEVSASDDGPTAERSFNITDPEPGDTVNVTLTVELPSSASIDYIDEFEPPFADGSLVRAIDDGERTLPLFQDIGADSAVVVFGDDTGPGTVELIYQLTVPEDSDTGTAYEFNSTLQVNGTAVPIDGPSELVVAGDQPPAFDIEIVANDTSESVKAGEELTVAATIENTGDATGTQSITFGINGTQEDDGSVTLGPGDTESVTFTYETSQDDIPAVNAAVASADDTATTTVDVGESLDPAQYQLSRLTPEVAIIPATEDQLAVSATVTNTGEEVETQDIDLVVTNETGVQYDDTVADVEIDPGQMERITFEPVDTEMLDVGKYTHEVSSEDDTISGELIVEAPPEPAFFTLVDLTVPESVLANESFTVTATVENTGELEGTQTLALETDGRNKTQTLTLKPDETGTVSFENLSFSSAGERDIQLHTANETANTTLAVNNPSDPPFFAVTLDTVDTSVVAGETVTVAYTITNVGDLPGTQDIVFTIDGSRAAVDSAVGLDSGETFAGTFEHNTANTSTIQVGVASENQTAMRNVTVLGPASFVVTLDPIATDDSVITGDQFTVTAIVENTGDVEATQELSFTVDGDTVDTERITLGGSDTTNVTFTASTTADLPADSLETAVSSGNDTATTMMTVLQDARFQVSITDIPGNVTAGETLTLTATVRNTGAIEATQDLSLEVDGATAQTETVSLNAKTNYTTSFEYPTTDSDSRLKITVTTLDATASETVTVVNGPESNGTESGADDTGLGFGPVTIIIAGGLITLALARRTQP